LKDVIAKGLVNNSLPANITHFSANTDKDFVQLNWKTINEVNTAEFAIEKSIDGNNFKTIGIVKAKNNASEQVYTFNDAEAIKVATYYRLKIIDADGKYSYSKTIVVNNKLKNAITVYPNPAKSTVTISYKQLNENATLNVVTIDGKQVLTQKLSANSTQHVLNVHTLTSGTYILTIQDGKTTHTQKFTKQ
jgi:hypothetical protein